eukprot:12430184-Karenia_brevis.AAC.1
METAVRVAAEVDFAVHALAFTASALGFTASALGFTLSALSLSSFHSCMLCIFATYLVSSHCDSAISNCDVPLQPWGRQPTTFCLQH